MFAVFKMYFGVSCVFFSVSLYLCVFQTMPTDMCALQDFDEPDKLQIQVNDVITIIEGRWVLIRV